MATEAIEQYKNTASKFLQTLSNFSEREINEVPFAYSWTPGQVGDHILKSLKGIPDILKGNTEPADRNPTGKEEVIKNIFLDFSTKLKSPDFIIPTEEAVDKVTLINSLSNISANIVQAYEPLDATAVCLDFKLPAMGTLTRLEWLCFITYHMQRHTWQLQKMAN